MSYPASPTGGTTRLEPNMPDANDTPASLEIPGAEVTEVVAALIWKADRFMICQRPEYKARPLLWEYVGGKVEPGETKEEALVRECREELGITVSVGELFTEVVHVYPDLTIRLSLFHASIAEGEPTLLEHRDLRWILPSEIPDYPFCPADQEINARILRLAENGGAGERVSVSGKTYRIIRLLGHGKGGYSYLAEGPDGLAVVKQIHHEPCDYYQFGNKMEAEIRDYGRLKAAGIRIPEMLALDPGAERLVKEYIEGPTIFQLVRDQGTAEAWLGQVREMAEKARAAGLNIDYFPTNFIVRDGLLWYVDYECNGYMEEWNFENWGVKYWSRTPEFEAYLRREKGDPVVEFRNYQDEYYEAVCDFLVELNRANRTHVNWNWARFEWMAEHPEFDQDARSSIGLWFDGEIVIAAAIYDMYFGEAFAGVLPGYEALYPEVLRYAWENLKDEAGLGIAVNDRDTKTVEILRTMGFAPAEQTETLLSLSLEEPLPAQLPEGFRLEEPDPKVRTRDLQWLFWQGFDHGEDRAEFERETPVVPPVEKLRKHFRPELGLAAVRPDGELASFACVWFHDQTDFAYVEPVCTIPSCRGRGVASALLSEALNRARALGAKKAYVISDQKFYKNLGFQEDQHYTFFWKKESAGSEEN